MRIKENIDKLKDNIYKICKKVNRNPDSIIIVGACKKITIEKIEEAYNCGIKIMGENIVQDAIKKIEKLNHCDIEWHMIGHLQTNKVKKAVKIFDMIQSIDSIHLAEEINKRAESPIPVLIEVNTSMEATKFGFHPDEVIEAIKKISTLKNIKICGLMTIGPIYSNPRQSFKLLRTLQEKIEKENINNVSMKYLSMGMSDDYEIAIEEGSNMLRIGRAIFGGRN